MSDMSAVIIPKSDQLNADDLLAGPRTVKITQVTIRGGQEQPISISFEGDNGKPYKACKSMCRVMVTAWGADSKKYIGRSMTLYRDASVRWGGLEVGGIRISHMSDIDSDITLALTMTRANRKPYTVHPLSAAPAPTRRTPAEKTAAILEQFAGMATESALRAHLGKEIHTASKSELEAAWLHFSTKKPDADSVDDYNAARSN